MVDTAQKYINENYPKEARDKVKVLNIYYRSLAGNLDLRDFINLKEINCRENRDITSLNVSGLKKLERLECAGNKISKLNIDGCSNINAIVFDCNELTDLDFLTFLNSERVEDIQIWGNKITSHDLSHFSRFVNLKWLGIGNHSWGGNDNNFFGSLKPLQNLTKLESLFIDNTDIDAGLEYLPENLEKFFCNADEKVEARCKNLQEKLVGYDKKVQSPTWHSHYEYGWTYYDYQVWREKNIGKSAQEWLDKEYWEAYGRRSWFSELIISKEELEGFVNLKKLDCAKNRLTNLDLSDCKDLTELDLSNNRLVSIEFLKTLSHPERITELNLSNNKFSSPQTLEFLTIFTGLINLNISNCSFEGSLKYLKDVKNLQQISISSTNINEGIEYLSESCQRFYCNSDTGKKSMNITKEWERYLVEHPEAGRYYNLDKWRKDEKDKIASSTRYKDLGKIRDNMRKYLNKWNGKVEKIKDSNELGIYKLFIEIPQWTGRTTSIIGGSLLLVGAKENNDQYTQIGGIISIVSPFIEIVTSQIKEEIYKKNKEKWEEFVKDSEELWDDYQELRRFLEITENSIFYGEVKRKFEILKEKVDGFLKEYDENEDGKIDESEWKEARKQFTPQYLRKNWNKEKKENKLREIVEVIENLEQEIISYRQGFYYGKSEEKTEKLESQIEIPPKTNN